MKLRPYQVEALESVRKHIEKGVRRLLIVAPTGCGKTCIFASVPKHLGIKGRVLVLVHREELADQAADKISRWNPELSVGVEMGDRFADPFAEVVVGSVQTLGRKGSNRLAALDPRQFGAIITDEAHHSTAESYMTIYEHFGVLKDDNQILLLGVTATPNRADGTGLDKVYSEVAYSMGILDAIKQGWLADIRGYKVVTDQSLDGVHTRAGDFAQDELSSVVNNVVRNEIIVKHWKEEAPGRPTLAFCVDIAHAKSVAASFQQYGIKAAAVWGDDPDRAAKLAKLRSGEITVLCNCAVLTEGYDDWRISCVIMARPTKSQLLFVQCSGRGTRIPDGIDNLVSARLAGLPIAKEDCVLIDVVDATTKHSLVTLPQLFGLPTGMDLKGRKITAALDHFNDIQEKHPNADLSQAPDLTKLNSYALNVDVFAMKWADEVLNSGAKLQWHQTGDGHYTLYHPKGRLDVQEDLLQKWSVKGSVRSEKDTLSIDLPTLRVEGDGVPAQADMQTFVIDEKDLPDLCDAFRVAEKFVREHAPESMTLVRREARWHHDPASENQIRLLKRFHVQIKPGLTKGEAQIALSKYLKPRS